MFQPLAWRPNGTGDEQGHESLDSSEVEAALGENDVVASLRSERRRQANIQLVRFTLGAVHRSVVPQRITRLDPLHQRAENGAQVCYGLDVEDFSTRLVHDLANAYQSWNHARCEKRLW